MEAHQNVYATENRKAVMIIMNTSQEFATVTAKYYINKNAYN